MTAEQRVAAARAFWKEEQAADEQRQAAMLIAQQKKFRLKTVAGLDVDRKAQHLASLRALPEALAARILVVYHLADQRLLMSAFLDALGLPHDNGLLQDDVKPDETRIAPAAEEIAQRFPVEDVELYLNTLLCQDPETWASLRGLAQLGA
jgi:hypothetical protein